DLRRDPAPGRGRRRRDGKGVQPRRRDDRGRATGRRVPSSGHPPVPRAGGGRHRDHSDRRRCRSHGWLVRVARVLIVDDEPDILLMLRVNLAAEGYDTSLAADGEKALQRIAEDDPDVVLLDVMMPVMD